MLELMSKKIFTFYAQKFCLSKPMDVPLPHELADMYNFQINKKCLKSSMPTGLDKHKFAV